MHLKTDGVVIVFVLVTFKVICIALEINTMEADTPMFIWVGR